MRAPRLLILTILVAGCGTSAPSDTSSTTPESSAGPVVSPEPTSSGRPTITAAFDIAISSLDPALVCDVPSYTMVEQIYDNLVQASGSGSPLVPGLAESWDVGDSNKVFTFNLRQGVTFSSGNPFTADDVVYSLQRELDAQGCGHYVLTGGLWDNITSIEALDPKTVRVTLAESDPLFLKTLAQQNGILDSKAVEASGNTLEDRNAWVATHSAGTGPFVVESYDPENEIVLTAREDYWGGAPKAAKVVVRLVKDASAMEVLATSGEIDLAYGIPFKDLDRLAAAGLTVQATPAAYYTNIGLNVKVEPLDDVRVRQALTYATPFDQIVETYGYGHARTMVGPLASVMPHYRKLDNPFPFDIEKAKSLLADAGVGPFTLTLDIQAGRTTQNDIATVLQDTWKEIGVTVEVKVLGSSAFVDDVYNFKDQAYMIEDGSPVLDPGYFLGYFAKCGDPFNWTQYCNQDVDTMLTEARHSDDQVRLDELYGRVSEIMATEAPYLMLFEIDRIVVTAPNVTGYVYYDDQVTRFKDITK